MDVNAVINQTLDKNTPNNIIVGSQYHLHMAGLSSSKSELEAASIDDVSEDSLPSTSDLPIVSNNNYTSQINLVNAGDVKLNVEKEQDPVEIKVIYDNCPAIRISDQLMRELIQDGRYDVLQAIIRMTLEESNKKPAKCNCNTKSNNFQDLQRDGPPEPRMRRLNRKPTTELNFTEDGGVQINISHKDSIKNKNKLCSRLFGDYETLGRVLFSIFGLGLTFGFIYLIIHLLDEHAIPPK